MFLESDFYILTKDYSLLPFKIAKTLIYDLKSILPLFLPRKPRKVFS